MQSQVNDKYTKSSALMQHYSGHALTRIEPTSSAGHTQTDNKSSLHVSVSNLFNV